MAQSAIARLRILAQPSVVIDSDEGREAAIACEAATEVMRRSAFEMINSAGGLPILSSKSCDGTPMRVVHRSHRNLPSGKSVATQGRQGVEFLVSNQFVRAWLPGYGWVTKVILAEPIPLTHGKTVPAILGAARRDWVTLRSQGHTGISLEHYVWDRLSIKSLERMSRQ